MISSFPFHPVPQGLLHTVSIEENTIRYEIHKIKTRIICVLIVNSLTINPCQEFSGVSSLFFRRRFSSAARPSNRK
ncbi:hypothetical protein TRIP_B50562 [uncultured Desulfatiglans sp.]|nr:hypothetical protein TRIP_B50562 [uncultured Desulfatiglans sp.]